MGSHWVPIELKYLEFHQEKEMTKKQICQLVSEGVTIAGWGATGFRQPTSDKLLQGLIRWPEQSLILLDIHRIVPSVSSQRRIVRKSFLPSETVKYYCQFFVLCKHFLTMRKGNLVK